LEGVKWEILPHLPYSPNIAPSDFHLFRFMQSALSGEQFDSYGIKGIKVLKNDLMRENGSLQKNQISSFEESIY